MFTAADLPDSIPIFPLPGALLLPRARLPLHIFEPRYLAMLDDALKTRHRLIGMVQPVPGSDRLHDIGCAGRVSAFSETDDGRYMVTLLGISRFQIVDVLDGFTPYKRATIDWSKSAKDLGQAEQDPDLDRDQFFGTLKRYFDANDLESDWDSFHDAKDEMLINSLCMLCPLTPEDKQALLQAATLSERREILTTLLDFSLRGGKDEKAM